MAANRLLQYSPQRCSFAQMRCGARPAKVVNPVVAKITEYGSLIDPGLNRDSCTSTLWSPATLVSEPVVFWMCRDTQQVLKNGSIGHHLQLRLASPQGYGDPFYAFSQDQCPAGGCGDNVCGPGICGDGTRWVGWPDTPPLVVQRGGPLGIFPGWVDAYGWMAKQRLTGLTVLEDAGNSLFKVTSRFPGESIMAKTELVKDAFWTKDEVGYGTACHVIHGGYAYLYGGTPNAKLAVARVSTLRGPTAFENRKNYEFYVNGKWTSKTPLASDPTIILPNTSQSKARSIGLRSGRCSFVWIGGDSFPDADAYISTAPNAEGPWTVPKKFYSGVVGNGTLPAYSSLAHPALTDGTGNYIFISWTKTHPDPATNFDVYDQPLVRVDWA
ncbi:hypothetical protein R3P38DRAFT_2891735 [Favolaschia claudopus]|uniref:DUF4185 domain-containing protein n=1 Tax=Favolaschia claudopus TaxID=2862362 RepID=A0AAW0CS19_9AGAR